MTDQAFLGVERSASGKRWELRPVDERLAAAIAQSRGLPDIVGRAIAGRGIGLEDIDAFLSPSLRDQMPDPMHLRGMDEGIARLVHAITKGEKVAVFGDYDVDGATSSALIKRYFAALGAPIQVYIPDRIAEGYGPNTPALLKLHRDGVKLVITVDCGITAFDPLGAAREVGLDVIVVDHHAAEPRLPPAAAVINPNRLDDDSPHGYLAAVGVTFLVLVALNRALRDVGWFKGRREPDLRNLLDLVALGTVADVVALKGLNRVLTAQGLKVLAQRRNVGLRALADVAGMDEMPGTYHLGFLLGPRINAGGRVGEPSLGADLLSTEDETMARDIARRLDGYNAERREIEAQCLDQAIDIAENRGIGEHLVYVGADGWHPGVIGIVAGRLKERYNRPACVVAFDNGAGKGSGRSVEGVDLGAHIIAGRQSDLLLNGGGHKMAAGFTVAEAQSEAFQAFLEERIAGELAGEPIRPRLALDGGLSVSGATLPLIDALETLAPFGMGNAEPRFALPHARIAQSDVVGADHVRCRIAGEGGASLKAIAFRCADQEMGSLLLSARGGAPVHLAGRLRVDRWQGREQPQLMIDDAAPAT